MLKLSTNHKQPRDPPVEAKVRMCSQIQIFKVIAKPSHGPFLHPTLGLLSNRKILPRARIRVQTLMPTTINLHLNSMRPIQTCQLLHIIRPHKPISKHITLICIKKLRCHHLLYINYYLHLLSHHLHRHQPP